MGKHGKIEIELINARRTNWAMKEGLTKLKVPLRISYPRLDRFGLSGGALTLSFRDKIIPAGQSQKIHWQQRTRGELFLGDMRSHMLQL